MNKVLIALALLWLVPGISATAESVNKENLKIRFEVGNMKIRTVDGTFEALEGVVVFDSTQAQNASFEVCIDAASVNTGNKSRDKKLKTEAYFHVEEFPAICFKSDSVEGTGEGYLAKGQLTMMGVTREVEIPFSFENGELSGTLTISRYDFGLASDVGTGKVSEEVIIFISYSLKS